MPLLLLRLARAGRADLETEVISREVVYLILILALIAISSSVALACHLWGC